MTDKQLKDHFIRRYKQRHNCSPDPITRFLFRESVEAAEKAAERLINPRGYALDRDEVILHLAKHLGVEITVEDVVVT